MKAMILAAGVGERLWPLTLYTPKVLLPIAGTPIIELIISWLKSHGISEIAINVHHLANHVMGHLGDGSHLGVHLEYSVEKELLGTAGGVKKMASYLEDDFVVVCGDIYTDFNLSEMIDIHQKKRAMATLALFEADKTWETGIVTMNKDGLIAGFIEKPPKGSEKGNLASGGVYVLSKPTLDYIPSESCCDFGHNVFPELAKRKLTIYGYLLKDDDYLIDIGTIGNYEKVNNEVKIPGISTKQLSLKVKALRSKMSWSQEVLARQIGVSPSTVQRWELRGVKPSRLAMRELNKLLKKAGINNK